MRLAVLSTIALAGMLTAAPAYAIDASVTAPAPEDRTKFPYGDALSNSEMQGAPRPCCASEPSARISSDVIEGRVAAVDRENGRLVLDTDDGVLSLMTWPDEVARVDVGDLVRVSFVADGGD